MRHRKCYSLLILLTGLLAIGSCRKESGIDNNNVVLTPYGVFFADRLGGLLNTNDGLSYKTFPGTGVDGVADRAIAVSGNNIIFIKKNLFVSDDNGVAFNYKINSVNPLANWASMLVNVPSFNRVYVASTKGFGLEYSDDHGVNWQVDNAFDLSGTPPPATPNPGSLQSLTQTSDGILYALDNTGPRLYARPDVNTKWREVTLATNFPSGSYYLNSFNNTLVAADYNGSGIYFSADSGRNWNKYPGLPNGKQQQFYSCAAPLGQTLLVGTDSTGIYRLSGGSFVPSNNGLKSFTSVYGITGKQDTYKNGLIKRYIYIATNTGLYRSEDFGQNWTLMYPADLRTIW